MYGFTDSRYRSKRHDRIHCSTCKKTFVKPGDGGQCVRCKNISITSGNYVKEKDTKVVVKEYEGGPSIKTSSVGVNAGGKSIVKEYEQKTHIVKLDTEGRGENSSSSSDDDLLEFEEYGVVSDDSSMYSGSEAEYRSIVSSLDGHDEGEEDDLLIGDDGEYELLYGKEVVVNPFLLHGMNTEIGSDDPMFDELFTNDELAIGPTVDEEDYVSEIDENNSIESREIEVGGIEQEDSDFGGEDTGTTNTVVDDRRCKNCKREESVNDDSGLLVLQEYDIGVGTKWLKKFCHIKAIDRRGLSKMVMCKQCRRYLIGEGVSKDSWEVIWPSVIWDFLKNKKLLEQFGGWKLWCMIPIEWRHWWLSAVKEINPMSLYNSVSTTEPSAAVRDGTNAHNTLRGAVRDLLIGPVMEAVDDHLLPIVKCPWGCDDYYIKSGKFEFDIMLYRFFGSSCRTFHKRSKCDRIKYCRDDYLARATDTFLLENKEWPIMPTVVYFIGEGPVLLTCRFHNGGSRKKYVHVPVSPVGTLSSGASDQVAAAIIVPRTISKARAKEYNHSFQMSLLRGQYDGVDTYFLSNTPRFNFQSVLSLELESLAIECRADTKALVSRWKDEEQMLPSWLGDCMLSTAAEKYPDTNEFEPYLKGSTMITLGDSLELQQFLKGGGPRELTIHSPEEEDAGIGEGEARTVHVTLKWPKKLIFVHSLDDHGACLPSIPKFQRGDDMKHQDVRLLWFMLAMVTGVQEIWTATDALVCDDLAWYGYVMDLAVRRCTSDQHVSRATSIFYLPKVSGVINVCNRLCKAGMASTVQLHNEEEARVEESENGDAEENVALVPTFEYGAEFTSLFSKHDNVTVYNYDPDNTLYSFDLKTDVVILRRDSYEGLVPEVPDSLRDRDTGIEWELRMVGVTSTSSSAAQNWSGSIFVRHGGKRFRGWWSMDRKKDSEFIRRNSLSQLSRTSWFMTVFVRTTNVQYEQMRNSFLTMMGGQTKAFCHHHDTPLIIAPANDKRVCCHKLNGDDGLDNERCTVKSKFICPVRGCGAAVCIKHHRSLPNDGRSDIADNWSLARNETRTSTGPNLEESREQGMPRSDFLEIGNPENSDTVNGTEINLDDPPENENGDSNDDRIVAEEGITEPNAEYTGYDADVFFDPDQEITAIRGLLGDERGEESDSDMEAPAMPTTVATERPVEVVGDDDEPLVTITEGGNIIPGCSLLNNCGSLLCRRKTKLRGTRDQQNFLQNIASNTPGRTVPLGYPEGMLFPSIFFKADAEGSLPGAIPCGMLASNRHLSQHGLASLQDHARTRVMTNSLRTSMDERYINFLFDMMLNLGLRRGFETSAQ